MRRPRVLVVPLFAAMTIAGCGGSGAPAHTSTFVVADPPGPAATSVRISRPELIGHLTHRRLRPGQRCPVTHPNPRSYAAPLALRRLLNGDLRDVYGHGALAVILPLWRPNVRRNPDHGSYSAKVGWWTDLPGPLSIAARRIDRRPAALGYGETPDPNTAARRVEATGVVIPTLGCWQVAGAVGGQVLTWIFRASVS